MLILLVAFFSTVRPSFLNTQLTLVPMQADISVYAVVGLAQLAVLSMGHMNMAVGRMAAMSAFASGLVYDRLGAPMYVDLLVGMLVGGLLGALAGLVIARTGVNSFVVTLALDFALVGLVSLLYSRFTDGVAFAEARAGHVEPALRHHERLLHGQRVRAAGAAGGAVRGGRRDRRRRCCSAGPGWAGRS